MDNPWMAAIRTTDLQRQALAHFVYATMQLLEQFEVPVDVADCSVNFDGRSMRVDIATLNADGRLDTWLQGLVANPLHPQFATSVPLPGADGQPQ